MILSNLRKYLKGHDVADYLTNDHRQNLEKLDLFSKGIQLDQNFGGFIWEGTITGNSNLGIKNLLNPRIPRYRIILKSRYGLIADGSNEWTQDFVYLINNSANDDFIRVVFIP